MAMRVKCRAYYTFIYCIKTNKYDTIVKSLRTFWHYFWVIFSVNIMIKNNRLYIIGVNYIKSVPSKITLKWLTLNDSVFHYSYFDGPYNSYCHQNQFIKIKYFFLKPNNFWNIFHLMHIFWVIFKRYIINDLSCIQVGW